MMPTTKEKIAALNAKKLAPRQVFLSERMSEFAGYIQQGTLNPEQHAVCVAALNDMLALTGPELLAATSNDHRWWLAQVVFKASQTNRPLATLARKEREIASYQRFFPGCRIEKR